MKRLIILLALLATQFMSAQLEIDYLEFQGKITLAVRDAFDVPAGKVYFGWVIENSRFEFAESDDVWKTMGDLVIAEYPNLDTDSTNDVDTTSDQDVGGVKNFTDRINQSINGSVYLGNNVGLSRTTAAKNVGVGEDALSSATSAQGNVAIGSHAMDSLITGLYNIAIGDNALATNTTNGVNIAIGADAMESALGAGLNVAIGNNTLKNTTSDYNTAVGHNVLTANTTGNYNVVTGTNAMTSNSTGSQNTVIGFSAMDDNTDGGENVAIGYNAGVGDGVSGLNNNTSADRSVYIGHNARPATVNSINEIVIGHDAVGNGDNSATIGNSSTTNTYIKGTVHGLAGIMEVNATSFNGNLTTTDTTIQKVADAVDGLAISGSTGFSLPVHVLDTVYASGTPSTAYLTDARFENSLNTTLGSGLGQRKVIISSDVTYNHDVGTVLWFQSGGETNLIISPDTGVSGFTEFTLTDKTALVKRDSNVWNILVDTNNSTLSEVLASGADAGGTTISNLGPPTLSDDAARKSDIDAVTVDTDGINKTTDFTLSDSDVQAQVLNIVTNDSIVVTVNPASLTEFGFVKLVVEGTGKAIVEGATNGDYVSASGEGSTIGLRVKDATKTVVLDSHNYTAYAPVVDAYQDASLVAKFSADDLAVGTIADWPDGTATYNFSTQASANNPSVTSRVDGRQQVEFASVNSETMVMDADYAALDFDYNTTEYTIVIAFGDVVPANSQALFTKGQFGDYQVGIATNTSGDNMTLGLSGTNTTISAQRPNVADGVWVIRKDAGGVDLIINDVEIITNATEGTTDYTDVWQLAGRAGLVNYLADVSFKTIAFYSSAISNAKVTDIYNQEQ